MGTIKQATYGDEKSSTDVTDSLVRMFKEGKGFVEVDVGPKLLQTKEAGSTVELTDGEADEIKKQAQESCGNALDDACMKSTTDAFGQGEESRD